MYNIVAEILKYVFITIILMFISNIIRLIYTDIRLMQRKELTKHEYSAYLKLISTETNFDFLVQKSYGIDDNVSIGRSEKCKICIDDPFLSQLHCEIKLIDGTYNIRDTKSTNGSLLNGKKIGDKWEKLEDKDVISMGQIDFAFVDYVK